MNVLENSLQSLLAHRGENSRVSRNIPPHFFVVKVTLLQSWRSKLQVPLYHHVKGCNLKELNTSRSRFTQFPFARFYFNVTWKFTPLLNLRDKFQFNVIWHRWSLVALVLHWRLAESDVTVMQSATFVEWLLWWYKHMADVVPHSTALAFVTKLSEKHKSTSPNVIQVKDWWKTIGNDEKLGIRSWIEKGEWIVYIYHNVRLLISTYVQFVMMLIGLQEVLSQQPKCLCSNSTTVLLEWIIPRNVDVKLVYFFCIINK